VIERLKELRVEAVAAFEGAGTAAELEEVRVRYLGRKSELNQTSRGLGKLPEDERRAAGLAVNEIKQELRRRRRPSRGARSDAPRATSLGRQEAPDHANA